MIYITGDTHGELGRFWGEHKLCDDPLTEKDYLVIAGDFSFVFQQAGTVYHKEECAALDSLEEKPYTILFIDGNHENFPRLLSEFPEEEWHGNKVDLIITHTAPQKVVYALRGTADPHEAELTGFLEWINDTVSFTHWYFGHWHRDERLTGIFSAFTAVYCDLHPVVK